MRHPLPVCLAALALAAGPVRAADGDIAVGGVTLFTIKATSHGQTPAQRAAIVTDRLPAILGDHELTPTDVRLKTLDRSDLAIFVRDRLLVTVTSADAAVNHLSVKQQANIWAGHLRQTLPAVGAKTNPNNIPADPPQ